MPERPCDVNSLASGLYWSSRVSEGPTGWDDIGTSSNQDQTTSRRLAIRYSVQFRAVRLAGRPEQSMSSMRALYPSSRVKLTGSGCIPVLLGDQTHHPFWDMLDWTKFSIFVADSDIDRLEDILLSYSWVEVLELQANLVLIRDAFLYPMEPDMSPNLHERGPFFFAMHSTALLRKTRYPVA